MDEKVVSIKRELQDQANVIGDKLIKQMVAATGVEVKPIEGILRAMLELAYYEGIAEGQNRARRILDDSLAKLTIVPADAPLAG